MIVELIASTVVTGWGEMRDAGWTQHEYDDFDERYDVRDEFVDADYLAEFAGRLCYQSWSRPNPATAANEGYLANILAQSHYSVLEHASATFYVAEVSRSLSHELVRHRHLSFSQVSQRYVDERNGQIITPPAIAHDPEMSAYVRGAAAAGQGAYASLMEMFIAMGKPRKEARQAARACLINATETKFVVTGNMRAWRDVIAKRISPGADAEMQLLARRLLEELMKIAPSTFQDMVPREEKNYDYETEGLGGT